jgi:hypothetical protein
MDKLMVQLMDTMKAKSMKLNLESMMASLIG